jgi:hypothetical protein
MKTVLFSVFMMACSEETSPAVEEPKEQKTEESFNKIDPASLEDAVNKAELVPSPVEMQEKLSKAGLQTELSTLVATENKIKVVVEDNDQTAIRTGVVLADLVLTIKVSSKEQILDRLAKLKAGFEKLGAGSDIKVTIEEFEANVNKGETGRAELLEEFDLYSQVMVTELEYEAGDWVVPLIQAGTWLEGANLVSKIMVKEGKYDSADKFFRQKEIVEYFISYVDRKGKDKVPDGVVKTLSETLTALKTISAKPKIEEADVKEIESLTSTVLSLL